MRNLIRRTAIAACAVGMAAGAGSATVGPSAASTCESVRLIATSTPRTPGIDWAENIGYDPDGRLWVTRTAGSAVQRLDRAGRIVGSVSVPFPGAVRSGPGGQMYVTSFTSSLPGLTTSGVIYRFDPKSPKPVARVFARGLGLPNGLAFDDDGFGYVGDTWHGVVRLRRNGTIDHAWSAPAPQNLRPTATVNGTSINGVAVIGDNLYVTMTTSLTGRVLRVPVSEPARTTVAADLTAPLPGFLDDLAHVGRSRLAVASSTGQLYIVDTGSGRFCGVQVGQPVTSVAAHPHDPRRFTVGTELGNVLQFRR